MKIMKIVSYIVKLSCAPLLLASGIQMAEGTTINLSENPDDSPHTIYVGTAAVHLGTVILSEGGSESDYIVFYFSGNSYWATFYSDIPGEILTVPNDANGMKWIAETTAPTLYTPSLNEPGWYMPSSPADTYTYQIYSDSPSDVPEPVPDQLGSIWAAAILLPIFMSMVRSKRVNGSAP